MESLRPEEVVYRTNSDSKSIIIVTSSRVIYAHEGLYGDYVLHPKDFDLNTEEMVEMINSNVLTFFVEPKKDEPEELPGDIKNVIDQYISNLPEEIANEFRKYAKVETINYDYIEVKPTVKKTTDRYIVLDFKPKKGGKKITAKAVRLKILWQGSRRHPRGNTAGKLLKEWQLKYSDNKLVQENMYAKTGLAGGRDSILYLKIILSAPDELVPKPPKPEEPEIIEDLAVEDIAEKILGDIESIELEIPETTVTPTPTLAPPTPAKPELVKVYLLKFKLPSKYIVQKVKYRKSGEGYLEVRDFSEKERADIASTLEGLRRRAYEKINREFVYVETYGLWLAVSKEVLEKAREVAKWLRRELLSLRIPPDGYYVRPIPIYMEPSDARELLYEAHSLLQQEVMKLKEKIADAEKEKKKKTLKRLEQQLSYKEKLLESLKNYIKQVFG